MTPELDAQHRAQLAETLERGYGCKPGMIHEGYGAECDSSAHAPALYRTFGCDHVAHIADSLAPLVAEWLADAWDRADDERAAKKIAADSADRFRDVLSECLGHPDENPGDDVLVAELRAHFGKTGPEPTRWRDFCSGALAFVDQIHAENRGGDS